MTLQACQHITTVLLYEAYRAHHVRMKVNQYAILHDTSRSLSGNHIPLAPSVSLPDDEARSMGTRRTIELGRASARNTGTKR